MKKLKVTARRILSRFTRLIYKWTRNKKSIRQLKESGVAFSPEIATAITETLDLTLDNEERKWVHRIEALRHQLNQSDEEIEVVDYGAGHSDEDRRSVKTPVVKTVIGPLAAKASKPMRWSVFLHKLIKYVQPRHSIELGTCLGISSAYMGAALGHGEAQLVTIEGDAGLATRAANNIASLDLSRVTVERGIFKDVLPGLLEKHRAVSFAFIDGHHDGTATLEYFDMIYPYLTGGAVLVFDDILLYPDMRKAWENLTKDPRCTLCIDLFKTGVVIIDRDAHKKDPIRIALD